MISKTNMDDRDGEIDLHGPLHTIQDTHEAKKGRGS